MIFNFRPARPAVPEAKVVMDLDRLIAEPVGFRWNGQVHQIKPMDTQTMFRVLNELSKLDAVRKDPNTIMKDVFNAYADVFQVVCSTITRKEVMEMYPAQIAALFGQIMDCVTGKAFTEPEKKTPASPSIA